MAIVNPQADAIESLLAQTGESHRVSAVRPSGEFRVNRCKVVPLGIYKGRFVSSQNRHWVLVLGSPSLCADPPSEAEIQRCVYAVFLRDATTDEREGWSTATGGALKTVELLEQWKRDGVLNRFLSSGSKATYAVVI